MSRKYSGISVRHFGSTPGGGGAVVSTLDPHNPDDDICPVCKTMRYLNRDMEFLINPECYHPMCSNCVNRIFNDGPNQCPYAGCHKTLRRRGFRSAYFGDLGIEREVDIRRRVATVFNKAEDDFTDLRAYNDYLQQVEDLVFALVNGAEGERRKAEGDLAAYEQEHKVEIERNKKRGTQTEENMRRRLLAEQEAAKQRRLEALKEDEEERRNEAKFKEEVLDGMVNAAAGQASQAVKRIVLKKRGQNRLNSAVASYEHAVQPGAAPSGSAALSGGPSSLSIRGLKDKRRPSDENKPYDPFDGLDLTSTRYALGDMASYHSEWVDAARTKDDLRVGGYSADAYVARAVFESFAGLAVFVEDEQGGVGVATAEAAIAAARNETAGKMDVDDVF